MPFCYRYRLQDPVLKASILKHGILLPVIVQKAESRYCVLAGHKRLEAARALKLKAIPVFEIEGKLDLKDAFLFSLISNWKQETSDMDRVVAIGKAVRELGFKPDEAQGTILPLLGLSAGRGVLELYLKAGAMPDSLKDLVESGKVPFRGCGALLRLSRADQDYFARRIGSAMKFTTGQLLQVSDWIADIVKRDRTSLTAILNRGPFREILNHGKMDPRTKADRFFDVLRRTRFPGYEAFLKKFEEISPLILRHGQDLRIAPTQGFEEKGVDLYARVKTPQDLDRILQKISESRPALNSLFDFML